MHRLTSIYRAQYNASSKKEKGYWVHRVIREIREAGGRFLQLTSSDTNPPDAASTQDAKPSRDFAFELVDDMTAYKKVSHAFRSKGRSRMLISTNTSMMPPSSSPTGNSKDDRNPAARTDIAPPAEMPSQLLAVSGIQRQLQHQQQTYQQTTHNAQQSALFQQQLLRQPQAGIAELTNIGLADIPSLESLAGVGNTILTVLAPLLTSNQYAPPQVLSQMFSMAQLQQLLTMNPGLSALLAPNLSAGTVVSNPTLDELQVLLQQQVQQQQLLRQQLSPVNALSLLTAPFLSPSSNTFPQQGMSIAMQQQLLQLLQANMVSPSSAATAAAVGNTSNDTNSSEQPRGNHKNKNNKNDSSQS
jgi:hypothetical protein